MKNEFEQVAGLRSVSVAAPVQTVLGLGLPVHQQTQRPEFLAAIEGWPQHLVLDPAGWRSTMESENSLWPQNLVASSVSVLIQACRVTSFRT